MSEICKEGQLCPQCRSRKQEASTGTVSYYWPTRRDDALDALEVKRAEIEERIKYREEEVARALVQLDRSKELLRAAENNLDDCRLSIEAIRVFDPDQMYYEPSHLPY